MEAAIQGILILRFAFGTKAEISHGGFRPVIRNVFDDCEAGTAVRAIDEGIPVPEICGCEHFLQAICTNTDIRRDGLIIPLHSMRALDLEVFKSIPLNGFMGKGFNPRERWGFFFDAGEEAFQLMGRSADFNLHPTGCVPHPSCKLVPVG